MNEIVLGDALEVLPTLEDESIDLVLTDPPYFISNEVGISRSSQGKYKGNDITHDFGEWDNFGTNENFYDFTKTWVDECARVLKPGCFFISFFDKRRLSWLFDMLEFGHSFRVRDIFTWVKTNPVPQVRKVKFAQATEMAVILSKPGDENKFQWRNGYHPNLKRVPIVGGKERLKGADGKTLHMTQKPERIIRTLMDYFCESGGVVLDPFAGTGTAAVEAIKSGRQYICIEREEHYYHAALERLENTQIDLVPINYKSKIYKRTYL